MSQAPTLPTYTAPAELLALERELGAALDRHRELAALAPAALGEVRAAREQAANAWRDVANEDEAAERVAAADEREKKARASVAHLTQRLDLAASKAEKLEGKLLALVRAQEQELGPVLEATRETFRGHVEEASAEVRRRLELLSAIPLPRTPVYAAVPLVASTHGRPMSKAWDARRSADAALSALDNLNAKVTR